jgi:solute carrier family 45, member 1/2/4
VWIAGPLSGLVMQPIVGIITDRSRSKWGRRRPFMIGGAIVVAICLLLLGWTTEVVGSVVHDVEQVWRPHCGEARNRCLTSHLPMSRSKK